MDRNHGPACSGTGGRHGPEYADQKLIFVPLSAFGDLGDVMSVSFSSIARGFRVSFHGGNTAASYDATLLFERGVLLRREVRLRELPDERWEKARYGFPSAGR